MADELEQLLEDVFRREWPAIVGAATRITGDLERGEEVAQDVLVVALDRWPFTGIPERPGAWLMTAARNRARNRVRDDARARARERVAAPVEEYEHPASATTPIGDDRLRLMFLCCHPALATEARIALTLRMVGGLSTGELARAFLLPQSTMAQRLVRAKKSLADQPRFGQHEPDGWLERVPDVLAVIYLIFNEGYAAASGGALTRPELCDEACRLAELVAELLPQEAEALGLHALVLLLSARLATRVDDRGDLVLLEDQDRTRWDRSLIEAGEAAIDCALRLGPPGNFVLQAMIAAFHARAACWEETDWRAITAIYDELHAVNPSPVVALNRAIAVSMLSPEDALDALATIADALAHYPPFHAANADILRRLGRSADAAAAYRRAAALDANETERRFLLDRAEECSHSHIEERAP